MVQAGGWVLNPPVAVQKCKAVRQNMGVVKESMELKVLAKMRLIFFEMIHFFEIACNLCPVM